MSTTGTPAAPLKKQRLIALFLCLIWCIIGGSIGLNALIKSNQTQADVREKVPSGVTVHFDIGDIYVTGVIITAVCATIALLAAIFILVTVVWPESATGSLKTQGAIFNLFNMTLLINQIIYTTFVANHRAKITAFLDGIKLSPQTVQAFITAIGQSDKYSRQHPAVLLAIFPWFSVLFTSIFVVVLFMAARRRDKLPATARIPTPEKRLAFEV